MGGVFHLPIHFLIDLLAAHFPVAQIQISPSFHHFLFESEEVPTPSFVVATSTWTTVNLMTARHSFKDSLCRFLLLRLNRRPLTATERAGGCPTGPPPRAPSSLLALSIAHIQHKDFGYLTLILRRFLLPTVHFSPCQWRYVSGRRDEQQDSHFFGVCALLLGPAYAHSCHSKRGLSMNS